MRLIVNGEARTTFDAFAGDNPDLPTEDLHAIGKLQIGETYYGGGGAAEEWNVTRVPNTMDNLLRLPARLEPQGKIGWTLYSFDTTAELIQWMKDNPAARMPCWARIEADAALEMGAKKP